jgi:uncharacterized protein (TIGR03000 family)
VIYESAPVEAEVEVQASTRAYSRYGTIANRSRSTGAGTLRVSVPDNAVVYVNDNRTTSTGSDRTYVSRGLATGRNYAYKVRVEFEVDGKSITQTKSASLTAGSDIRLVFDAPAAAENVAEKPEPPTTELSLTVPANAKVTLAGSLTQQTGEQRQFSTTRLSPGETWENYVILVEVERDGKTVEMERTITLIGGQSHEETFDFDAQLVAAK